MTQVEAIGMSQITLRGIPEDIEHIVKKEAKVSGTSLNKAFISLLRRGAECQTKPQSGNKSPSGEFDAFLGLWSEDETASFDAAIKTQRKIEEELWS
jgi:hypothetical protein